MAASTLRIIIITFHLLFLCEAFKVNNFLSWVLLSMEMRIAHLVCRQTLCRQTSFAAFCAEKFEFKREEYFDFVHASGSRVHPTKMKIRSIPNNQIQFTCNKIYLHRLYILRQTHSYSAVEWKMQCAHGIGSSSRIKNRFVRGVWRQVFAYRHHGRPIHNALIFSNWNELKRRMDFLAGGQIHLFVCERVMEAPKLGH